MIPGYWPGASGQTAKVGILPYLVVTMTSCSSIARSPFRQSKERRASREPAAMSRDLGLPAAAHRRAHALIWINRRNSIPVLHRPVHDFFCQPLGSNAATKKTELN